MTATSPSPEPLRVLSLGAGVQSSAVLLMAAHGELPPFDLVVFADTGDEPPDVYRWLDEVLRPASPFHIEVVTAGDIKADALDPTKRFASMPVFTRGPNGSLGRLRRQCTREYKIDPVRTVIWALYRAHGRKRRIELTFGISWDEAHRMTDPDVGYIDHAYPLVDRRMRREDCQRWLEAHGYDRAPKSACSICPFRSDAGWLRMAELHPDTLEEVMVFDEALRAHEGHRKRIDGTVYLHRDRVPLRQAIERATMLRSAADMQEVLFADDGGCRDGGYCDV